MARLLAGVETVVVPYPEEGTAGALVRELAARLPALVGPVFTVDGTGLAESFVLSFDGRAWTRDPDAPLGGAPSALLLSNVAGGATDKVTR